MEIGGTYSTALKVISSSTVREAFFQKSHDPSEENRDRNNLANSILSINGPIPANFHKVNLYRNDGFEFEYGDQYFSRYGDRTQLLREDWVQETFDRNGRKYILASPRGFRQRVVRADHLGQHVVCRGVRNEERQHRRSPTKVQPV